MQKIGIGLDYSNICKDYNTVYLDRDNNDRATVGCMNKVMEYLRPLLSELIENFNYKINRINNTESLKLDEIVQKRFLFYSLEKEITLQTFILENESIGYESLVQWEQTSKEGLLISNDEEGEGVYFYCEADSKVHKWLLENLKAFSLDEVPFESR